MRTSAALVIGWVVGLTTVMPFLMWLQNIEGAHEGATRSVNPVKTATHGKASAVATVGATSRSLTCPPCDILFSKLETDSSGRRVQVVEVQERGEPKSGTSFMFEWAGGLLIHACEYLKKNFGDGSCRTGLRSNPRWHTLEECSLIFEPRRATRKGPCVCEGVER